MSKSWVVFVIVLLMMVSVHASFSPHSNVILGRASNTNTTNLHAMQPMGSVSIQEDISVRSIFLNGSWIPQWTNITVYYKMSENYFEELPNWSQDLIIIALFVFVFYLAYLVFCWWTRRPLFGLCTKTKQAVVAKRSSSKKPTRSLSMSSMKKKSSVK